MDQPHRTTDTIFKPYSNNSFINIPIKFKKEPPYLKALASLRGCPLERILKTAIFMIYLIIQWSKGSNEENIHAYRC